VHLTHQFFPEEGESPFPPGRRPLQFREKCAGVNEPQTLTEEMIVGRRSAREVLHDLFGLLVDRDQQPAVEPGGQQGRILDQGQRPAPRDQPQAQLEHAGPVDAPAGRIIIEPALPLIEERAGAALFPLQQPGLAEGDKVLVAVELPDLLDARAAAGPPVRDGRPVAEGHGALRQGIEMPVDACGEFEHRGEQGEAAVGRSAGRGEQPGMTGGPAGGEPFTGAGGRLLLKGEEPARAGGGQQRCRFLDRGGEESLQSRRRTAGQAARPACGEMAPQTGRRLGGAHRPEAMPVGFVLREWHPYSLIHCESRRFCSRLARLIAPAPNFLRTSSIMLSTFSLRPSPSRKSSICPSPC